MARRCAVAAASALALGLVACGGAQIVHHAGDSWVESIDVRGNHAIDGDTILDGLALARARDEGGAFDPYELTLDARRVEGLYARRGFFDAHVETAVAAGASAGGERVTLTIAEGPRAPLVRVDLSGAPDDVPAAELRALIATRDGEPFDYDAYDDAKARLATALADAGYAHAQIEAGVIADHTHHEAVIRIAITAGPRCTFGDVTITGVDGPDADAARARLALDPGDTYSSRALVASQGALYDMGRFATVRVVADRSRDDAVVPVAVNVVRSTRNELRAGGGVAFDQLTYQLRPHVGYSRLDSPWPLWTLGADLQPAIALPRADLTSVEPRITALAALTRIDLWRPRLTGEIALPVQYLTVEAYTSTGPRVRLGLSSPLGRPEVVVHAGWSLRELFFVNINPIVDDATRTRLRIDDPERVGELDESLTADFRDHPLEPTRGVYAALRVAEAAGWLGSAFDLVQIAPDLRGYLPLGPIVVSAHARAGAILGDVPATDRYFAGGASSQRGFPERQLSPSATSVMNGVTSSVVVGGGGLIETGVEARARVWRLWSWPVEVAGFLDGGDVTETAGELDPTHLHWAAGGGVRVVTKYVPIRIDVGYRLNRYGAGEPLPGERVAFHLGIGEAF